MTDIQKIAIPAPCRLIIDRLRENGYHGYAVGGCIRDSLLERVPNDWDITTDALPQTVCALFSDFSVIETGLQHGTVTVLIDHTPFEVTTFRIDGTYSDGRRPDSVTFTTSITDDLARRDFTVNAMAYNDEDGLIDPFNGREDLSQGIIRCVGDPARRFAEDALRLFRAIRFAAQLGFMIENDTLSALKAACQTITLVAKERIFTELKKTVSAPHAAQALRLAPELLFTAVPELGVIRDVPQRSRYHIYDVWEHTLHAIEAAPQDTTVRLAVLFHDVGKGVCHTVGQDGFDHFYGHPVHSAKLTSKALHALKCDNKTLRDVVKLVELHDTHFPLRQAKFRRLLSAIGYELFDQLVAVSLADSAAHAPQHVAARTNALLEAQQEAHRLQTENYCLHLNQLAVNGRDMQAIGFHGQAIGETLNKLLDSVIIGDTPNDREVLLLRAERLYQRTAKFIKK